MLRQKWSRGQVEARFPDLFPSLIGMEACVGAHHLSRKLKALGHDARLMPAPRSGSQIFGGGSPLQSLQLLAPATGRGEMIVAGCPRFQ